MELLTVSESVIFAVLRSVTYFHLLRIREVAHQQAEMRMVRWMCGVKLQDRVPSKGLRERLD